MTTEEIKTLIDQKIAGQGTMVDVGGALPTILKEFADAMANIPAPMPKFDSIPNTGIAVDSIDVFQDAMAIKVGGKVFVRNDGIRTSNDFGSAISRMQTDTGCTVIDIGAIFCEVKTQNYNVSGGRRVIVTGFAVLRCTPDPNPSALRRGIFPINND